MHGPVSSRPVHLKDEIDKNPSGSDGKGESILEERALNDAPLIRHEIGEKYQITREAVSQNEVRLINKIKKALGVAVQ